MALIKKLEVCNLFEAVHFGLFYSNIDFRSKINCGMFLFLDRKQGEETSDAVADESAFQFLEFEDEAKIPCFNSLHRT